MESGMKPSVPVLALASLFGVLAVSAADNLKPLTEEQRILHVLNRLGYGPRPGDVEKVKKIGVRAYIEQQLTPERIPDPVVDQKLATFKSLSMKTPEELEKAFPVV